MYYPGPDEYLLREANFRIEGFRVEADISRLCKEASRRQYQTIRLGLRQRLGYGLVRCGLLLAGKSGRYLLYLESEGIATQ